MFKQVCRFTNLIAVNTGAGPELRIVPAVVWLREKSLKIFMALVNLCHFTKKMLQERNNSATKLKA